MKNLKWFWVINYLLTIISIIFTFLVLNISELHKSPLLERVYYIVTINEKITPLLAILEGLQIPLTLIVLIWKKMERTKIHWFYFIFLILLSLAKIVFYFYTLAGPYFPLLFV